MKKSSFLIRFISLILILCFSIGLSSCKKEDKPIDDIPDDPKEQKEPWIPANVTVEKSSILTGTIMETAVYHYTTDKEGPKIAIVGGIHGDELAGWTEGLNLVDTISKMDHVRGEILLIPQANILADNAHSRYSVKGYNFTDLNRSFPLGRANNVSEATLNISEALRKVVEDFDADYIIDLHESQHSWVTMESGTKTSLGDTLIANNNSRFMRQLIKRYNEVYKPDDEVDFRQESSNQVGSFNYYFTNTYSKKVVFTIETNRGRVNSVDTIALEKRVRQQANILESLFDFAWERIEQ